VSRGIGVQKFERRLTTHNAEAILFDYHNMGDALWDRFNGGAAGTRWYYESLANIFSEVMPGRLSDRLSGAATAFSDLKKEDRWVRPS
jgi:hypothetical protein